MGTIAAGKTSSVTLPAGQAINTVGTGVAVLGPGPWLGQQIPLQGNWKVGPFDFDVDVGITAGAGGVVSYDVGLPPESVTFSPTTSEVDAAGAVAVRQTAVDAKTRAAEKLQLNKRPLIRAAARANSTPVILNAIRRFTNGQLVLYTAAGTTDASEPAFSSTGPITDGGATCYALGSISLPAPDDVEIPTMSEGALGSIPAGLTDYDPATNTTNLLQYISPNIVAASPVSYAWLFNDGATSTAVTNENCGAGNVAYVRAIEFETDSTRIAITSISGSVERYVLYVDDRRVEEDPTAITTTGASRYVLCTYVSRQMRRIRIECRGSQPLRDIRVDTGAVIQKPTFRGLSCLWTSDSYHATESPTQGFQIAGMGLAYQVTKALGFRYTLNIAAGGIGYIANTTNTRSTAAQSIAANSMASFDPKAVFCCHGYNDRTLTPADVAAAARSTWALLRSMYPNAVICVIGPWSNRASLDTNSIAVDAAVQAAFIAWGDANSEFESPMTGSYVSLGTLNTIAIPWVSGSGYVGATTGVGNSDVYTGPDTAHPSPSGKWYLKARAVAAGERMLTARGL